MDIEKLKEELRRDEGYRDKAYRCTAGHLTIGYGHNLTARHQEHIKRCTKEQAEAALEYDIEDAIEIVKDVCDSFDRLSDARQRVVVNMAFCLGRGIGKFKTMLGCLAVDDYEGAADAILDSKFAKQTGDRAKRLEKMMREG